MIFPARRAYMETQDICNLKDLFIAQLREQFDGEHQQLNAFPRLKQYVTNTRLERCIDLHIGRIKQQITRLEEVFSEIMQDPHGETDKAVTGLLEEAADLVVRSENPLVRDAGLITAIQHLNHHNVASYGTLRTYAMDLGKANLAELLDISLREEEKTDQELTGIAEAEVNLAALHPESPKTFNF